MNQLSVRMDAEENETVCAYTQNGALQSVAVGAKAGEKRVLQQYKYNARGEIIGIVDGNGQTTSYQVDGWGRITRVTTPDETKEAYAYTPGGQISKTTDGNGNEIRYKYNSYGKVREIIDQEGKRECFQYDGEQNLTRSIDRNGNIVDYQYNVDGNVVQVTSSKAVSAGEEQERKITDYYTYDKRGRLSRAVNDGFAYEYRYDEADRLIEKRSSGKSLISYEYDQDGKVVRQGDGSGQVSVYEYDQRGKLVDIYDGDQQKIVHYDYRKDGKVKSVRYKNGIDTQYEYDSEGNIIHLRTRNKEEILLDFTYLYDGNGNRIQRSGNVLDIRTVTGGQPVLVTTRYAYSVKNQLIEESSERAGAKSRVYYGYDPAGNRIRKETKRVAIDQVETYRYDQKNQLIEWESDGQRKVYTYDKQGNIRREAAPSGTTVYEYNGRNQQTRVVMPQGEVQVNRYDPEGMRAEMEENGKLIRFIFHQRELAAELDETDKAVYNVCRGIGGLAESQEQDGEQYYYHRDEQGSIVWLTDEAGSVKNQYTYDAFGVILEKEEQVANRITYVGQQYDGVTGQYYLRARYYNPVLGRFMQEDTYRGDGLNLYAYCRNNPVTYYDFSGYEGQTQNGQGNKGNSEADVETELFLPDEYYDQRLPKFTLPGTENLSKYDQYGNLKQTKYYDDYGRERGWVDFSDHGYPSNHTIPHWHEVQWSAQYPIGGYQIDHRTDSNPPF